MFAIINTIDTFIEDTERGSGRIYARMEQWRKNGAEVDMWTVAGHELGTLYSDYRRGLMYIEYFRRWVMSVIDTFVAKCEGTHRTATMLLMPANEMDVEPIIDDEPEQHSSTDEAKFFYAVLSTKKYKLRGESVILVEHFTSDIPESVKRYKLRGEDCVKLEDLEALVATK